MNICRFVGHSWIPVFLNGIIKTTPIKIIVCYCTRCRKGHKEIHELINSFTHMEYNTYKEKYFDTPIV
jgi:hypothetical protein